MAVARSRGAVMVLLVSILCREGLCFQAFQAPALMAHKSGFASVCSFRAFSVGAFRTAGSPRHLAGQGGRRCRGAGKGGVQGLSAKATPDYYKVLGVEKTADTPAIKRAYKRLAVKFHPDVNKEAGAKDRFVEVNEAYSVLSDAANRKKYDTQRNPFEGWNAARPGAGASGFGSGFGGAAGGGTPFDFDAYWSQFRTKEETPKDINDSFESIFDDLFSDAKSRRNKSGGGGGGGKRESLMNNFGDFLETMLGRDDMKGGTEESDLTEELEDEELRAEVDDCAYVVSQLGERAEKLRADAAAAEGRAGEWERKGKSAGGETAAAAREKAGALQRSATRLRDRAGKVAEMQTAQQKRLERLRERLRGPSGPSGGKKPSSSGSSAPPVAGADGKEVVSCPQCAQKLRVPAGRAGTAKCPSCAHAWAPYGPASAADRPAEAAAGERRVVECPKCSQRIGVPGGKEGMVNCPTCANRFSTTVKAPSATAQAKMPPKTPPRGVPGSFPDQFPSAWAEEQKMKQELAKARAEDDLAKLKKELGL